MKRRILAVLLALGMVLALAACGGSAKNTAAKRTETVTEEAVMESSSAMGGMTGGSYLADMKAEAPMEPASPAPAEDQEAMPQKLIRTAWLELETTEFEEAVRALTALTEEFGGYFENSSVANRGNGSRWGSYTVRIPAERYEEFLNQAGTLCHETWRSTSQEDISEVYYDTAGRLKTQQIKLERLQELLSRAELMEDIITIENAISETEQRIDDLSGTLQHYDARVDYATVYVYLNEVYKLSNVEEVPEGFGSRLGNAFVKGWDNFLDNAEDLLVSIAYGWMGWLIFIVVVVVAAKVSLRAVRKRKAKKEGKICDANYTRSDEQE